MEEHSGHRERLKQRLLNGDDHALYDYELLETVLFYAVPRRDVKPDARKLLDRFDNLEAILHAPPQQLAECLGYGGSSLPALLKLIGVLTRRMALGKLQRAGPLLVEPEVFRQYCLTVMSALPHEEFRTFWLNAKGHLLRDEVQHRGTLDRTAVYPRELVRRGIELGAAGVILAHNHPSGDPTPSRADIKLTETLVNALNAAEIRVYDHVVIGFGRVISFQEMGLLG